jgi:hypothetical protein
MGDTKRTTELPRRQRRGQVLVEFALIALVMYLLLAATIEFGRMMFAAQTVQSVADFTARELARTELPAHTTFQQALREPAARAVYDEHFLVISLDDLPEGMELMDYVAGLPPVNQQLFPLMVLSYIGQQRLLRYPGALVEDTNPDDDPPGAINAGLLVKVPVLLPGDTIEWHDVVEAIAPADSLDADPFSIASNARGVVALRINYPFQAAALSGYRPRADAQDRPDYFAGNVDRAILADDSALIDTGLPDGASPVAPDPTPGSDYDGTYGGAYGLGEHGALASRVRPYRKVVSANGVARREIFSLPSNNPNSP